MEFRAAAGAGNGFTFTASTSSIALRVRPDGISNLDDEAQTFNVRVQLWPWSGTQGPGSAATFTAFAGNLIFAGNSSDTTNGPYAVDNGGGLLTIDGAFDTTIGTSSTRGVLTGAGGLTKSGTGILTLTGSLANNYTGSTSVNAGTLLVAKASALGTTTNGTTVSSGATLAFQGGINYYLLAEAVSIAGAGVGGNGAIKNVSGNNTFAGAITMTADSSIGADAGTLTLSGGISGGFNLAKVGQGSVILTASNNYTGATTISAGTLKLVTYDTSNLIASSRGISIGSGAILDVTGVTAAGHFALAPNQTLSGNGTVTGDLTIASGSTIAPGDSIGTLHTGNETWNGGGRYEVQLNTNNTAQFDQLVMSGLDIAATRDSATKFTIAVSSLSIGGGSAFDGRNNYTWLIAVAAVTNFDADAFLLDTSGFQADHYVNSSNNTSSSGTFSLSSSGGGITLAYNAVPEPTSLFLLGGSIVPLLLSRRRRSENEG